MTQRTRHKGPSNRFFCDTNVLGIDFLRSKVNFYTKYNVRNVLDLLNMTTF